MGVVILDLFLAGPIANKRKKQARDVFEKADSLSSQYVIYANSTDHEGIVSEM